MEQNCRWSLSPRIRIFFCAAIGSIGMHCQNSEQQLVFDVPFPQSDYHKVLDFSMQIYGDVRALQYNEVLPEYRLVLMDCTAGRLIRLATMLTALGEQQMRGERLLDDDAYYLANIIARIEQSYRCIEQAHCYREIVHPLFTTLQQLVATLCSC